MLGYPIRAGRHKGLDYRSRKGWITDPDEADRINLDHSQAPPVRATVECHRTRWRLRSAGRRRPELGNGPLRRPAGPPIALEPSIKGRSSPSCCSNRAVADLAAH